MEEQALLSYNNVLIIPLSRGSNPAMAALGFWLNLLQA